MKTAQEILSAHGNVEESYQEFVRALFNRSGDLSKDFAHAILGIVTEVYELRNAVDEVHANEESGDLLFYEAALDIVLSDFIRAAQADSKTLLADIAAGDGFAGRVRLSKDDVKADLVVLMDAAKRWVGYGKAPSNPLELFGRAVSVVSSEIERAFRPIADFEDRVNTLYSINVEKLLKRYNGMKFDAERAVNRDLAAERQVLERASAS